MQHSELMSATGTATRKIDGENIDILVDSIRLIPALPYSPVMIPDEKLREAIRQVSKEHREARDRQAALNGSKQ